MTHSILYIHDNFANPGDCFSYCGARHYVNKIGVVYEQSVHVGHTTDIPSLLTISGPDHLVVAGAPWIWDRCTASEQYAGMTALLRMSRGVHKTAIGIGSCFLPEHFEYALTSFVAAEKTALYEFWSLFDEIVVRDILAWHILDSVGIRATLAPCPSIAVGEWFGKPVLSEGELLLSEDLTRNFLFNYLKSADIDYYRNRVTGLHSRACRQIQWVGHNRVGLHSRSLKSICAEIVQADANRFFTARVHASLVATGMGMQGELMALDSRALSAELVGVQLVGPQAERLLSFSERLKANGPVVKEVGTAVSDAVRPTTSGSIECYTRVDAVSITDIVGTTRFFRNRLQHQTLLQHIKGPKILLVGASRGCEAYSLAIESILTGTPVTIDAIDIEPKNVAAAWAGVYQSTDMVDFDGTNLITEDLGRFFTTSGSLWMVRQELIGNLIRFSHQDLFSCVGQYDAIICNNVLIDFSDQHASAAIDRLVSCLTPGGVLALGGVSQDVVHRSVVRQKVLVPITDNIEGIWDSWKGDRLSWQVDPDAYVAMPPLDHSDPDWAIRFSTLFLKSMEISK